jgi:hypothetical protein
VGISVIDGSEVKRIREALGQGMGREVSQLGLGVMLGLNLASLEVTKWEDEAATGPEAVALSYLSLGLPGFRCEDRCARRRCWKNNCD